MGVGVPIYEIRNKYLCEVFPFYEIYEKLQKVEDMNTELINSKKILEEKIAQCESNVGLSKSNEEILADYIGDETELFYTKVPANLANEWRTFCSQQIYSKRYMLELALLMAWRLFYSQKMEKVGRDFLQNL